MPPRINIPPVTRTLLVVLFFQSILSASIRYRQWSESVDIVIPYLTLIPQLSINYPWTFLTTTLVENNVFTLTIAAFALYHGGRYLERAWSSADLAKFLVLVSLVPNLLTFGSFIFLFALTRNESWALSVISGSVPVQISFLVAFSQLVPAHTVTLFRGFLSLRVVRFPLLYLSIVAALSLTPLLSRAAIWLSLYGFLTSWTYLRFFKSIFPNLDSSQPASLRGDASETFAFAEFFPGSVRPIVASFSDRVFETLVAMRICSPFAPSTESTAARGERLLQRGMPGSARAETERRRAIALKALDQRLSAATANASSKPPPQPSAHAASQEAPLQQSPPSANSPLALEPKSAPVEDKLESENEEDTSINQNPN